MELDPVVTGTFTLAEPEPECILDSVPVKSMMLLAKKRQDFVQKFLLEKRPGSRTETFPKFEPEWIRNK